MPMIPDRPSAALTAILGLTMIAGTASQSSSQSSLQASFQAARFKDGSLPSMSPLGGVAPLAVGGGEVMLEVTVGSAGDVRAIKLLRTTPPFAEVLETAVRTWRFIPASARESRPGSPPADVAVESTVLVAGIFRAPTLNAPTIGEAPRDVASERDQTAFPVIKPDAPLYPPLAVSPGIVLIETTIDVDGRPSASRVIRSSPPFDQAALDAVQRWVFRAARIDGVSTPTFAYVVFGFPVPVTPVLTVTPVTSPPTATTGSAPAPQVVPTPTVVVPVTVPSPTR
jgi:TonB family protein